ncbi:MAG: DUF2834 domain-containing protein [Alphaproteobacteria bacterium]|nr:DUF2834 domain-containing protein [Alphaproteobacteria bacterium]
MSARFVVLIMVIVAFGALTALALADVGYFGILEPHFKSFGGAQVFTDLVIALTLVMIWMVRDGRTSGINPWPFVALTLVLGSFGPLFYLALRTFRSASRAPA